MPAVAFTLGLGLTVASVVTATAASAAGVARSQVATPTTAATTYSCTYRIDPDTIYLYAGWSTTLTTNTKYGQANDRVKEVQCLLTQWAADRGSPFSPKGVDGQFGSNTKAAVTNAQKLCFPNNSTQWDGEVGTNTWPCLRLYW
jgi:peptidoglycan hydrolase-like protein with peptidoglycan-binding domain